MTDIPYCDETWDLTIGCRPRSEGCDSCWATHTVHRIAQKGVAGYQGQVEAFGCRWAKTDRVNLLTANLDKPLHWRKPRFVFVNSKSDLFDARVPFAFIGHAFDVMNEAYQHRYMVLTKEPAAMARFIRWYMKERGGCDERPTTSPRSWPETFGHVILMVSVESPGHLDRVKTLIQIPAHHRGVSLEPLLEPIAVELWPLLRTDGLSWVVVGCEKLPGGRAGRWSPHPHCMREEFWNEVDRLVDVCRIQRVPIWVKQGPGWPPRASCGLPVTHIRSEFPRACRVQQRPF